MAKAKGKSKPQPASAQPAVVATTVVSTAQKLTKRSGVQLGQVLVAGPKADKKLRAAHNDKAWQAVKKALPATADRLIKLPECNVPECVSAPAFISYMVRRGYLAEKK